MGVMESFFFCPNTSPRPFSSAVFVMSHSHTFEPPMSHPGVCTVLDDDDSDTEASVRSVTSPALSMCSLALTIAAFCALCTGQAREETDALDKFPGNPVKKDTEARPAQKI